ncbi:MAG: class II fumarate hydratase [Zoogloeaceae bacterium]|nr:class II fumarate hydratase [Zoogloeaceae bacterium]
MNTRIERDSMGEVAVPSDRYWGAQTQRSLTNFEIGRERHRMPGAIVRAFGVLKLAAARANAKLGELDGELARLIEAAAGEVADGALEDHFPLVVFQTGSGTQSNMNANEVIANRANELAGEPRGVKRPVHPNDHVNRGQSSNDTFPTAMHVAVVLELHARLYSPVLALRDTLASRARAFEDVVKSGRTHLMDATPVTLGQEIGAWVAQIDAALEAVRQAERGLLDLAIGGTAVGTGLNAHPRFGQQCATELETLTGHAFRSADNRFAQLAAHDALVNVSAALRTLAGALFKMANDVRWLASGPRTGIAELLIPENEPGSSIMPGKVNPTQAEALTMVCARVFGNDATVAFAGTQGNFQLNVYKPVMAHGVLESLQLLGDAAASFDAHCARGIDADRARIADLLSRNLMLVTALNRHIGYDRAAEIAKKAHKEGSTLKEAALALGYVSAEDFDRWVDALAMTRPDPE